MQVNRSMVGTMFIFGPGYFNVNGNVFTALLVPIVQLLT